MSTKVTKSVPHVKIVLSKNKKCWDRYTSADRINWTFDKKLCSLSEVMKCQQEIIDNNHILFYNMIMSKK